MSDDPPFRPSLSTAEQLRDMTLPHFHRLLKEVCETYPETPGVASPLAIEPALGCWLEQQPNSASRRNPVRALDKMLQQVGVRVLLEQETY